MKTKLIIIILALIIALGLGYLWCQKDGPAHAPITSITMEITSSRFNHNENIPALYTCDDADINPPLIISGTSEEAKSLVLIVDDPDAPAGTWVHWTVFNIDPKTTEISENTVPQGSIEGLTSFNSPGYGGPCPPSGTHRYVFKIYALDETLDLDETAKSYDIEQVMEGYILDQAELIGLYSRE